MQSLYAQQEVAWVITWVNCPTTTSCRSLVLVLSRGHFYGPFLQGVGYSLLSVSDLHPSYGSGWLLPLQIKQGLYIWFSTWENSNPHVLFPRQPLILEEHPLSFWMPSAKPKLIKWRESMNTKKQKGCRAGGPQLRALMRKRGVVSRGSCPQNELCLVLEQ